jgi:hypothetical protein
MHPDPFGVAILCLGMMSVAVTAIIYSHYGHNWIFLLMPAIFLVALGLVFAVKIFFRTYKRS